MREDRRGGAFAGWVETHVGEFAGGEERSDVARKGRRYGDVSETIVEELP